MIKKSTLFLFLVFASAIISNPLFAEVIAKQLLPSPERKLGLPTVGVENVKYVKSNYKVQADSKFVVFDSLANVYSYGNMSTNKAIKYEPKTNKLVTIKRGFIDNDRYPSYSGNNTKNNLFIRVSGDWGKTWEPAKIAYDKNVSNFDEARYPSLHPFVFENELAIGFNASRVIEKQSVWTGHIIGFWNDSYGSIPIRHSKDVAGYSGLEWGIDSRVYANSTEDGEGFYHLIVSRISPTNNQDVANANHIGLRKVLELSETSIQHVIPPAWASSNFRTASPGYRTNEVVDFKEFGNGNLCLAVFGGFEAYSIQRNTFGISISTDKGETWSEFILLPWSVVNNFITSKGHPADSAVFIYDNKGFTTYELNNTTYMSFVAKLHAFGTGETISYVVEINYNYNTGEWKIYPIAQDIGGWILYQDITDANNQRTNWNDNELDVARTVDGRYLLAKWVGLIDFDPENNTFKTTDVFVSIRNTSENSWSSPVNITNSDELDRMTLLPDFIPNDLRDVPIFKMATITTPNMTEQQKFNEQFYGGKDQYLLVGNFDIPLLSVEDEEPCNCEVKILNIKPNPINSNGTISVTFYMPKEDKANFTIFDVTGRIVDDLKKYDNTYQFGPNTIEIDISGKNLQNGTYYFDVFSGNKRDTKVITIVK